MERGCCVAIDSLTNYTVVCEWIDVYLTFPSQNNFSICDGMSISIMFIEVFMSLVGFCSVGFFFKPGNLKVLIN